MEQHKQSKDIIGGGGVVGMGMVNGTATEAIGDGQEGGTEPLIGQLCPQHTQSHCPKELIK
jgi:hypothetical protein